nr:unnamed protein product [Callosobruchus chinensis]
MAKRGKYGKWSTEDMELALRAYRNGDKGLNQCSRDYGINKATILRHLRDSNKVANGAKKSLGRNCTFNEDIERQICERIVDFAKCLFGLTPKEVRKLAFDVAEANRIPHQFNREKKTAGKKWYSRFMKRNSNLSLRQPQATSLNRIKGFNRENVYEFFDLLEKVCDENQIDATRIYNMDESGFSTVAKKCQKVVSAEKQHVGFISSGERGVNTAIVCCVSAAGFYVPPMIIFKRKRYTVELSNGAPPGSKVVISDSGYINSEFFVCWIKHFIEVVRPSKENKVLLLLDGHTTHCKNLDALNIAREAGVIMIQLPGHTTNRLQPLDRSLFKPMEVYYSQAMEKWLRSNVGRTVSQYQVAALLNEAYSRAATLENAANGFRASGVWPVNRHVFQDSDFVAYEVVLAPSKQQDNTLQTNSPAPSTECNDESEAEDSLPLSILRKHLLSQVTPPKVVMDPVEVASNYNGCNPSTMKQAATINGCGINHNEPSTSKYFLSTSLDEIAPLPKAKEEYSRKYKGIQRAVIITSSPYKDELQQSMEKHKCKPKKVPLKEIINVIPKPFPKRQKLSYPQ